FCVQLLATKPRALVLPIHGLDEFIGQVRVVVVRLPASDHRARVREDLEVYLDRSWRGRQYRLGIDSQAKTELVLIPRFLGMFPFTDFIAPSFMMLRSAK